MLTVNGRPFTEKVFKEEMKKEIYTGIFEEIKESAKSVLSSDEMS